MLSGAQPWHHKTEHDDRNQISEAGRFMLQGVNGDSWATLWQWYDRKGGCTTTLAL